MTINHYIYILPLNRSVSTLVQPDCKAIISVSYIFWYETLEYVSGIALIEFE